MMRTLLCVAMLVAIIGLAGCVAPMNGPVIGGLLTIDAKGPVAVGDPDAAATKVGRAEAAGILLVAYGDSSISAAAKDGNITRIHHVDVETLGILGIYARSTTIIYGE